MNNGQLHDDPLFRAVQERLGDYEAPYEAADWDAMSRSLDQLPNRNRFRIRFSLNALLALVGVAGAIALATWMFTRNENAAQPLPAVTAKPATKNAPSQTTAPVPNTQLAVQTPEIRPETVLAALPVRVQRKNNHHSPLLHPDQFRFGDQIDPMRGFVKKTNEEVDSLHAPAQDPPSLDPFIKKATGPSADSGSTSDSSGDAGKSTEDNSEPK
ncbi:MAG: hypothetical protein MUC87_16465 [Bacteroidia bacterium]|jgi:hypothetical protein|nr:hypothetical protein [Bacteroidia bacterium]